MDAAEVRYAIAQFTASNKSTRGEAAMREQMEDIERFVRAAARAHAMDANDAVGRSGGTTTC
jgi:hypothetical protein